MSNITVCPQCQSNARRVGSTLTAPPSPIYGCTLCGHEWRGVDAAPTPSATDTHCTHEGRSFLKPCPVCTLPKTPAEKALERDEERREERFKLEQAEHKLHMEVLQKQLTQMDADAAYRKALLDGHLRQTVAMEGILRFLRESREEDLNRSRVVMD